MPGVHCFDSMSVSIERSRNLETHESALAAAHLPETLLKRVGVLAVPESLDGDDMLPVDWNHSSALKVPFPRDWSTNR